MVNDNITGVLEHTVLGTVQLLADRGYGTGRIAVACKQAGRTVDQPLPSRGRLLSSLVRTHIKLRLRRHIAIIPFH